jgi:S-adenosylmethionine:tRNA ribosyltransferase-isomerase
MNIKDFEYTLPKELIAQRPASPRTHSRLMVLHNSSPNSQPIQHKHFYDLPDYLQKGDVLVLNETKVLKIKLEGKKSTGGKIELMLDSPTTAVVKGKVRFKDELIFPKNIKARILSKQDNKLSLQFNVPYQEVIKKIGKLPTPPYIKTPIKSDEEYQTIYAKNEGSFAAPTAGLHFDQVLLKNSRQKG